jgi:hypothetical protein
MIQKKWKDEITKYQHEQSNTKHLIEQDQERRKKKGAEKTYKFEQAMETKN